MIRFGTSTMLLISALVASGCWKERPAQTPPVRAAESERDARPHSGDAAPITSGPAPHEDESEEHDELPNKVRLPPSVIKAAGVVTAPAGLDGLPATVDLTGEIAADPDRSARLAARVAGRVVDVRVKEGDRIKTGHVVAVLDSAELARARATFASAVARAKSARLNTDRLKSLESKGLAAGQETSAAEAEAEALESEVAAARQGLAAVGQGAQDVRNGGARVTIRTPIAGFVLSRDAVQGESVGPEHVIAVIGDLDRVYFLGRLFEKDLARVKVGAISEVRLNAYPNEVFEGKIETIGRQLDPAARTVTARILVRNHGDMVKVGLFGTARVVVGPAEAPTKRVVVPLAAVTRIADKDAVFVLQSNGDFELHPVTLGRTAGGRVEILTGLRAGEKVVTDGVFTLKSAVLKSTFGEEE